MKQLDVEIMGQRYLLTCPEGAEGTLLNAAERVDMAMCKIRDAGKVKARDRIAVLASLNLAFELAEAQEKVAERAISPAPAAPDAHVDTDGQVTQLLQRLDQALTATPPNP